jgi:CheY-like chemotaxis protein
VVDESVWDEGEADTLPGRKADSGARIMVVDDDPRMRALVEDWLTADGYEVREAISGYDLIATLETMEAEDWPLRGVDLLIVDHRMPGMTGMDALASLRQRRWDVSAILMTAFPAPELRRRAAELGVMVLAKPFSAQGLVEAVGAAIAR